MCTYLLTLVIKKKKKKKTTGFCWHRFTSQVPIDELATFITAGLAGESFKLWRNAGKFFIKQKKKQARKTQVRQVKRTVQLLLSYLLHKMMLQLPKKKNTHMTLINLDIYFWLASLYEHMQRTSRKFRSTLVKYWQHPKATLNIWKACFRPELRPPLGYQTTGWNKVFFCALKASPCSVFILLNGLIHHSNIV